MTPFPSFNEFKEVIGVTPAILIFLKEQAG